MPQMPFDSCIVLLNPASAGAKQMPARLAELRALYGEKAVRVIETSATGRQATQQKLLAYAPELGPRTLLCIGGGDGTVSTVVQALLTDPKLSANARKTPILPLWGGNANDLAHMLNGSTFRVRLQRLIAMSHLVAIHPLECRLSTGRSTHQTHLAICYASFGATAFASKRMNETTHRKTHPLHKLPGGRLLLETITAFTALLDAPTFRVEEQGRPKIIYERTFSNGSRFAKIDRLPIRLTDNMFYLHTLENKRLASVVPHVAELAQKRLAEKFLRDRASFVVAEQTLAQFDGEVMDIAAGTRVRVRLSPKPFWALSTLLKPDDSKGSRPPKT